MEWRERPQAHWRDGRDQTPRSTQLPGSKELHSSSSIFHLGWRNALSRGPWLPAWLAACNLTHTQTDRHPLQARSHIQIVLREQLTTACPRQSR